MYDIIIVGAGPAGLTAAIYAKRASKKVLVIEEKNYGGQIINTLNIENYPAEPHISGFDFATKIYNQAKELGAEIIFDKVEKIKDNKKNKEIITTKNTYKTKTIILATGTTNRKLNLDGEDQLLGKGISYCATCDGAFYKNKNVAVVGGGNTAIEDAIYLSDIVDKVYLIHRRDEFRASESNVNILKEKNNIEYIYNSNITKIKGNDKLESIEVTNSEGKTTKITLDGLFVAIGRTPETKIFSELVNTNDEGYILAKENCQTNISGIFVAGDNREKELRQLVTATSDGAIAATAAVKYINNSRN